MKKKIEPKIDELGMQISEAEITYKTKVKPTKKVTQSHEAVEVFRSIKHFNDHIDDVECFYVMYLNRASKILAIMLIGQGGIGETTVDNKIIFRNALLINASIMILCHNHPSGNIQPSNADEKLTDSLCKGAKFLDLKIIDHVIITSDSYFSFADEGMI